MDIRHVAVLLGQLLLPSQCVHILSQDFCEGAMDIGHVPVLMALRVLPREWVHIVRQD